MGAYIKWEALLIASKLALSNLIIVTLLVMIAILPVTDGTRGGMVFVSLLIAALFAWQVYFFPTRYFHGALLEKTAYLSGTTPLQQNKKLLISQALLLLAATLSIALLLIAEVLMVRYRTDSMSFLTMPGPKEQLILGFLTYFVWLLPQSLYLCMYMGGYISRYTGHGRLVGYLLFSLIIFSTLWFFTLGNSFTIPIQAFLAMLVMGLNFGIARKKDVILGG